MVTAKAWMSRMWVAMPFLLVFWKNRGRYPAFATTNSPEDGPPTHVTIPAKTPMASATAMIGAAQGIPAHANMSLYAVSRLCVRLMSACGTTNAIARVPSTKMMTVPRAAIMTAIG